MAIAEGNADRSKHKQTTVAKVKQNTSNTTAPAGKGNRAYVGRSTAPAPQMQSSSPVYYRPPAVSKAPAQRAPITTPQYTQKLLGSIQSRVEDPGWIDYFENKINEGIEYQRFKLHEDYLQKKSNYEDKYLTRAAAAAESGMSQEEFEERFPARKIKDNSANAFINMKKVNLHLKDYLNEVNNFGPNTSYAQKQAANSGASDEISGIFQSMTRNRTERRAPKELQAKTDLVFEKDAIREAASGGYEVSDEEKQRRLLEVSENGKIVTKEYATDHGTNFFAKILEGLERTVDKAALGPDGFESGRPQDLGANLSQYMLGDIAGLKVEKEKLPSIEGNEDFEGLTPVGTEKELRVGNPTNKLQEITNKGDEKANWFVNETGDAVWDQIDEPVKFTLDMLSRPLNAAAEGYGAIGAADDDPRKNSLLRQTLKSVSPLVALTDVDPTASVDDFAEDPAKIWDVVKAAGSGLTNEYQGGFGKVIAEEAKRNPTDNIYDKKGYQAAAGIALDVLYDPLNFVGVGLISGSSRGIANAAVKGIGRGPVDPGVARIAKQDPELQKHAADLWQEYRRIPSSSRLPTGPKSVNEIYDMLTSKAPTVGKFTSHADKAMAINTARANLDALRWEIDTYGIPESKDLSSLSSVANALKLEREGVGLEAAQTSMLDNLERVLETRLDRGELTQAHYDSMQEGLYTVNIAPMMSPANKYRETVHNAKNGYTPDFGDEVLPFDKHVAQVEDLEAIVKTTKGADKDAVRKYETAKADLENRRRVIGGDERMDIYDQLGPRIQYDPRFTREMVNDTFEKVYVAGRKQNPHWQSLEKAIKAIPYTVYGPNGLAKRPQTDRTRQSISDAWSKRKLLQEELDHLQAATFIRALTARAEGRTNELGGFANPERAQSLMDLGKMVEGELKLPDYQYKGANADSFGEAPQRPDSWNLDGGIDDHPAYFGRHQQLEDMQGSINRELEGLKVFNEAGYLQHLPNLQNETLNLGKEFPSSLAMEDGSIDVDKAMGLISINPTTFEIAVKGEGPEAIWAQQFADVVEQQVRVRYMDKRSKVVRRRRDEEAARVKNSGKKPEVTLDNLTPEQQEVLAMFGKDDDYGVAQINTKGAKSLSPVVTAPDGTRVALGTGSFSKNFKSKLKPKHLKAAAKNKQVIEDARLWVAFKGDESKAPKLNTQALTSIRKQMIDAGVVNVPRDTKKLAEYLIKSDDRFTDPMFLLGNEVFKAEHGMSILEARRARDHVFQDPERVVTHMKRTHTRDDYTLAHYGTLDEFKAVFEKGPFKVKYAGKYTEKQWRDAGSPPLGPNKEDWYTYNWKAINKGDMIPSKRKKMIDDGWKNTVTARKMGEKKFTEVQQAQLLKEIDKAHDSSWLSGDEVMEMHNEAIKATREDVKVGLEMGSLQSSGVMTQRLPFEKPVGINSTPDEIHKALVYRFREEEAALRYERARIAPIKGKESQVAYLDSKLDEITRNIGREREAHKARVVEYKETQKQTLKRIDEEHLLNIAKWKVENPGRELNVITAVGAFKVPGINALMKRAGSAAEDSRIAKAAQDTYNSLFRPPSKELGEFADVHRTRRARSDQVIQGHLEELHRTVGSYPTGVRKSFFKAIKEGNVGAFTGTPEQLKALEDSFEPILTALNQPEKIMDDMWMNPRDILEFVPDNLRFSPGRIGKVNTTEDLIKAIRQDVKTRAKDRGTNPDFSALDDPLDVAWNYRIALEKARAKKAFSHTVGKTWGVRNIQKASAKGVREDGFNKAIGELKKNHGWTTVEGMGDDYIFPPEVAQMVHRMNELNSPRELYKFEKAMDSALGFWKATATIYNPSYWVKNGIGEVYVSYLAGVRDPAVYKTAATLAKHARGDGAKLEALRSLHPMLEHMKNPNPSGSRKAITTAGGYDATYDDLLVGYHEGGLKTGFFNNDLKQRESAAGDLMRDHGLGGVTRAHEGLRSKGEGYEDFLRMGHYIDAVKKSSKPLPEAMADAADIVRKYHFDYDDFSMFEKTAMLRAIPFYKWTRKAVPLMIETLFLHPGKVANPFKIQNYVSNELTSQDFLRDDNGYMPNYEGIAPEFLKDSLVYQLFEGTEEADGDFTDRTFGGLPLPTGDVLRTAGNPLDTLQAMANPYGKLAKEVGEGMLTQEPDPDRPSDLLKGISPQAKMADRLGNNPTIENLLLTLGIPAFSDFKKDDNFDYLEYQKESGR